MSNLSWIIHGVAVNNPRVTLFSQGDFLSPYLIFRSSHA